MDGQHENHGGEVNRFERDVEARADNHDVLLNEVHMSGGHQLGRLDSVPAHRKGRPGPPAVNYRSASKRCSPTSH